MRFIIPVLAVFLFASCTTKKGNQGVDRPMPYDVPPTAPIPPEKYCFMQAGANGHNTVTVELTTEGDSVYGEINYTGQGNSSAGDFSGKVYGTTVIVNYKANGESGSTARQLHWKLLKDSLYVTTSNPVPDSVSYRNGSMNEIRFSNALYKVPCK